PPAEIRFGDLASVAGEPSFDRATGTCASVYCHGDSLGDAAASLPQPRWFDTTGQVVCGSCHGLPPTDHASDRCETCHGQVVDDEGAIIRPELHIDGVVQ